MVWGLVAPPGGDREPVFRREAAGWSEAELGLELRDLVSGAALSGARVLLGAPGGRQYEGRSDEAGLAILPLFLLDDFPFRLRVQAPAHEPLDLHLRGADLARRRRRVVLLVPEDGRATIRGSLRAPEGLRGEVHLRHRWWLETDAIRPAGIEGELRSRAELTPFELPDLPIGADWELEITAALGRDGQEGLAGLRLRGRVESDGLDLGVLEPRARPLGGHIVDAGGRGLADRLLEVRLRGWGERWLRARSDRWGRYVLLVPEEPETISGRATIGEGAARRVEIAWQGRGSRAEPLVVATATGADQ